jgi:hypothetical protein
MLNPDLSTASLHVTNTSELASRDFYWQYLQKYRICEDTIVRCGILNGCLQGGHYQLECGVYVGLTPIRFVIWYDGPAPKDVGYAPEVYLLFSCPASGRFAVADRRKNVVVLDLL